METPSVVRAYAGTIALDEHGMTARFDLLDDNTVSGEVVFGGTASTLSGTASDSTFSASTVVDGTNVSLSGSLSESGFLALEVVGTGVERSL